jgi:hypothetical protein
MNDASSPEPPVPERRGSRLILGSLLGLAPIPIGLLIGPQEIFNQLQRTLHGVAVFYFLITAVCGLTCGLIQSGGLENKKLSSIFLGVLTGILIAVFNIFVVFFTGCCCSAVSNG